MRLRDDCENGKLTAEEYKRWMAAYSPNRKRAEDSGMEKIRRQEYFPVGGFLLLREIPQLVCPVEKIA